MGRIYDNKILFGIRYFLCTDITECYYANITTYEILIIIPFAPLQLNDKQVPSQSITNTCTGTPNTSKHDTHFQEDTNCVLPEKGKHVSIVSGKTLPLSLVLIRS